MDRIGSFIRLVRHKAGKVQPMHAHEEAGLSILLAGEVREAWAASDYDLARPALGWKPAGARHRNRFGPSGALIASIGVTDHGASHVGLAPGWHAATRPELIGPLVRLSLLSDDANLRREAVVDLVGLAGAGLDRRWRTAPAWLDQARQMLRDDPAARLNQVARRLGVHRVHLSRSFSAQFGVPPSVYRLRSMIARAISLIDAKASSLGEAAHGGEFSDHSHAARAVKRSTGLRLAEIRALVVPGYIRSS
jgi:AraC family transcriptional regulator